MSNSYRERVLAFPSRPGDRIGLLAGWGKFPIVFAEAAQRQGFLVQCVGLEGMYSEELPEICDHFTSIPLARMNRMIRYFKRRQAREAVMAGKIEKRVLMDPLRLWRLWPDWRTARMWLHQCVDRKDDTLLLAVIREFAKDGIHFESALKFCPEILVRHGFLTKKHPTAAQWKDIHFGWELAKSMGKLDVGQTVVVNDLAVIAVEAIEGTDECIRRAGTLCRRGGTVVKVAKPQQDDRFDVPTIGLQTIQNMREAGMRVLAVETGATIILDEPEVVRLANKSGIVIVSVKAEELQLRQTA